ncbi:MAG TPA: RNase A-like domain-containing protein [Nocardioides sp.]|nr:RNase A-like domain-containing protein [Nocardioides sp.]
MRLAVEGTGYQSAVEAYVTGNLLAVDTCRSLSAALDGYAGMAGDDSAAAEFAATYDEAAAASSAVLGELTLALAALGHLTDASLHNLAWADTVSGPPTLADRAIGMRPASPPSALGGDSSLLPGWANLVLDLLEGAFWPDADSGRLRAAGSTWRAAATSVGLLAAHCSTAISGLSGEVSPEVPLAIAATEDLRAQVEGLADQLVAIAAACEAYADHVDAKRAELLDLLHELAWELGIGAVVSGALTFLSGGGAAGAAGSAGAARLAAASEEAGGILASLSALTRSTATTLRPVSAAVRDTRAYLSRLAAARRMEMTERGSIQMFGGSRPRGWLSAHEKPPGHTLGSHVGLSDARLLKRLQEDTRKMNASTFLSSGRAERLLDEFLTSRRGNIQRWLESTKRSLALEGTMPSVTGRTAFRDGHVELVSGIRVILLRDPSMPEGFHILTSYPQP